MHLRIRRIIGAALLAAAPFVASAHEPGPHQHGVAKLQVAVDGPVLSLFLDSPLENLLGFEHYPSTQQQRAAVSALRERLQDAKAVFVPTPAARCAATTVRLESPVFETKPAAGAGGHADLEAEYSFRCDRPDRLRDVEVRLFDGFPDMRRIDVQVAGPRGQVSAALSASNRTVAW
jgi:hypothetical protein